MSEVAAIPSLQDESGSKKRKRTGKDRKQAKILAEQAEARMQAIIEAAKNESKVHVVNPSPVKQEKPIQAGQLASGAVEAERVKAEKEAAAAAKREPESIAKRIPQGLKAIHPLLKQARTFETQRLIKKIKWSRTKGEDVTDMEAQISAMTNLNLHDLASAHLRTKLSKHHLFKHTTLPTPIVSALTTPESQSTSADAAQRAKAENRLVSNKAVADGVRDILAWVVGDEGARLVGKAQAQGVKGKLQREIKVEKSDQAHMPAMAQSNADEDEDENSESEEQLVTSPSRNLPGADGDDDEDEGLDAEEAAADAAGWESGSVDDDDDGETDDEDGLDSDLDDEEPDSGAETDDSDAIPIPKRAKPILSVRPPPKASSNSAVPIPKSSTAAATKPEKLAKSAKTKPAKPEKPHRKEDITSSLFLPSLASGFTRGDSDDSDPDLDIGDDGVIGKKGAERKNRRGQRARQAIWEKKYGKNAKHVVRSREADNAQQAQTNIRNAYGNRAGPATNTSNAAPTATATRQPFGGSTRSVQPPTAARYIAPGPAVSSPAQPKISAPSSSSGQAALHPSWEAARRKKQLLAAAPAAQKIVFD